MQNLSLLLIGITIFVHREGPIVISKIFMNNIESAEFDPFSDYVGTKLFDPEYKRAVLKRFKESLKIAALIEELAGPREAKSYGYNKSKLEAKKNEIVGEMIADMSSPRVFKMFAYTIKTLLQRLYHLGVHVNDMEVAQFRNTAKECALRKISLIIVPCHKSHIDYLTVSYVLFRLGVALPHIAAGDNLNMPFVGWVLRHNGAFFIRREWGGDRLYQKIMQEYIDFLLEMGYNLEVFTEGTRSRTGKLLQPKLGFLKLILESVTSNPGRDAMFVPVNIGYDKVIETPSYVNELMGTPKQKESIFQMVSNISVLQLKWGRIDVRFGTPFSLAAFIHALRQSEKIPATMSVQNQNSRLLLSLGYLILNQINSITSIMPTALTGTVLLTLRGRGVGRSELIRKVKWLKNEIEQRGGKVAEGRSSTDVLVDRAIGVLGDLIGKRYDILESVYYPLKRFELSYYRNQVIHLFISECIVCLAMYSTIKVGGPIREQRIPIKSKLLKEVKFLSHLLRFEFVLLYT